MAVGFPTKVTYANGDVFSAGDINDTNGTLNLLNPTAKGSIVSASAANTPSLLAVGANDTVLTADSTAATGLKWAAPATSSLTISQIASGSLTTGTSLTISSLSTYNYLQLRYDGVSHTGVSTDYLRINNNSTGGNYLGTGFVQRGSTTDGWTYSDNGIYFDYESALPTTSPANSFELVLENCKATGFTTWRMTSRYKNSAGQNVLEQKEGVYIVAEAVSSLVIQGGSTYSTANYKLWGG